jgi:hypothetical protein
VRVAPPTPSWMQSPTPHGAQPNLQAALPAPNMPGLSQTFDGVSRTSASSASTFPDMAGDVGPNYFVQAVNTSIVVYSKSGGLQAGSPRTFDDLFSSAPTDRCKQGNHHGNPLVLYDKTNGQWIVGDLGYTDIVNRLFYECLAITAAGDPTGTWILFALATDSQYLTQDLRMALWSDSIFMSANL